MRSYVSMNRMNSISRPAISGFNFSCLQCLKIDQIDKAGKENGSRDAAPSEFIASLPLLLLYFEGISLGMTYSGITYSGHP